jgi:hypothetical protein
LDAPWVDKIVDLWAHQMVDLMAVLMAVPWDVLRVPLTAVQWDAQRVD